MSKNKKVIHVLAVLMMIILILTIVLVGEKTNGGVKYIGKSENFSAVYTSSYFIENWFINGKKVETSFGGKSLVIRYIGDRKKLAKDSKITFNYDFNDIVVRVKL